MNPHLTQGSSAEIRPVGARLLTEVSTAGGIPFGGVEPQPSIRVCTRSHDPEKHES